MTTSRMPGTTPARNSRPIEVSVAIPYRIIVIDGGIRMPSVPPAHTEPAANPSGTPRRIISGTPALPIAAAVAGLEPQIAENTPQDRILAITSPPGTRSSQRCTDS